MTQTIDFNKMGLAPMNEMEMQETDGGNPILVVLATWFVLESLNNPRSSTQSLLDGWNSFKL
jgi:hypothetical protein